MKVLVTGSNGFIGKNLISRLQEENNIEIVTFDIEDTFEKIKNNIKDIDFIFHLAGINRPQTKDEFYSGNSDLTKKIVDLIKGKKIPLLITSSIQAELNNDYGKSKKIAEEYIKNNLNNYYIYRLHNVFGKWCRPNYNSVVATFCNNIAHDETIQIDDPKKELTLIYIDDVVEEFINILYGNTPKETHKNGCHYIKPRYNVTLKYLSDKISEFRTSMNSIFVPKTGDDFIRKLYSTYISYLDLNNMIIPIEKHTDDRGSFAEILKTFDSGQFSISYSKPGIVRGNHYHHTKIERFIVVKGKARISFKNIISDEKISFEVSDEKIEIVTIPVGYTHKIENIGKEEMILAIWCNELFNEKRPDTFFREVKE